MAIYRCKIIKSLNVLSETAGPILTRFHMGPSVEGMLTICSNCSAPLNKMAAMPIYGKTLKNLRLQNKESFEAESWYTASGTRSTEFVKMMRLG